MLGEVAPDEEVDPPEIIIPFVDLRISAFFVESRQGLREELLQAVQDKLYDIPVTLLQHTLGTTHAVAHFAFPQVELYCLHNSLSMMVCKANSSAGVNCLRPANLSLTVM